MLTPSFSQFLVAGMPAALSLPLAAIAGAGLDRLLGDRRPVVEAGLAP